MGVGGSESAPAASGFGVLDGLRRPKPGWQALVEACHPLIVTVDPLPETVRGGDRLDLAVHVVNDTRTDVGDMQVQARVLGPGGAVLDERRWAGSAVADDCVLVGRLSVDIPVGPPGTLTVELTLTTGHGSASGPAVAATNRYTTAVV